MAVLADLVPPDGVLGVGPELAAVALPVPPRDPHGGPRPHPEVPLGGQIGRVPCLPACRGPPALLGGGGRGRTLYG